MDRCDAFYEMLIVDLDVEFDDVFIEGEGGGDGDAVLMDRL